MVSGKLYGGVVWGIFIQYYFVTYFLFVFLEAIKMEEPTNYGTEHQFNGRHQYSRILFSSVNYHLGSHFEHFMSLG